MPDQFAFPARPKTRSPSPQRREPQSALKPQKTKRKKKKKKKKKKTFNPPRKISYPRLSLFSRPERPLSLSRLFFLFRWRDERKASWDKEPWNRGAEKFSRLVLPRVSSNILLVLKIGCASCRNAGITNRRKAFDDCPGHDYQDTSERR